MTRLIDDYGRVQAASAYAAQFIKAILASLNKIIRGNGGILRCGRHIAAKGSQASPLKIGAQQRSIGRDCLGIAARFDKVGNPTPLLIGARP
jgi:hypothetical protein